MKIEIVVCCESEPERERLSHIMGLWGWRGKRPAIQAFATITSLLASCFGGTITEVELIERKEE